MLVVSGPSGSGKDSLVSALRRLEPDLAYSTSVTTRAPRPGELDGVHYHFVTHERFRQLTAEDAFIETREYAGNLYGTPKKFVDDSLRSSIDVVMKPEVHGAMAMKRAYRRAALVFVTAPTPDVLAQRLMERSTESGDAIARRLEIAQDEMQWIGSFDYLIVNETFEFALQQLHTILMAERLRTTRVHEM